MSLSTYRVVREITRNKRKTEKNDVIKVTHLGIKKWTYHPKDVLRMSAYEIQTGLLYNII